jgi:ribosomal protein S18 acetylase RimI-like enzyme
MLEICVPVLVRTCVAEDLPLLEWYGLFRDHREHFTEAFARHLAGDNVMLVADLRGFPVGQAWIDLVKHRADRVGYVWAVRVFPFLRGLGIGTQLIQAAECVLAERGYRGAELGVEKDNPDARRLYERLGYGLVGEERAEYAIANPDGAVATYAVEQWLLRKSFGASSI